MANNNIRSGVRYAVIRFLKTKRSLLKKKKPVPQCRRNKYRLPKFHKTYLIINSWICVGRGIVISQIYEMNQPQ